MPVTARCRHLLAATALMTLAAPAAAERVRFRYAAADISNPNALTVPGGPTAVLAERAGLFGRGEPVTCRLLPTHLVTFRHPATGGNVTVPVRFPDGTPRVEHRGQRIIYNYGSYTVEAAFLPDGSVDVIYNSGPGRPLGWCSR